MKATQPYLGNKRKTPSIFARSTGWISLFIIILLIALIIVIVMKLMPIGLCPSSRPYCQFIIFLCAVSIIYLVFWILFRCHQMTRKYDEEEDYWHDPNNLGAAFTYGIRCLFVTVWLLTAILSSAIWGTKAISSFYEDLKLETSNITSENGTLIIIENEADRNENSNDMRVFCRFNCTSYPVPSIVVYAVAGSSLLLIYGVALLWLFMILCMTNVDKHLAKKSARHAYKLGKRFSEGRILPHQQFHGYNSASAPMTAANSELYLDHVEVDPSEPDLSHHGRDLESVSIPAPEDFHVQVVPEGSRKITVTEAPELPEAGDDAANKLAFALNVMNRLGNDAAWEALTEEQRKEAAQDSLTLFVRDLRHHKPKWNKPRK